MRGSGNDADMKGAAAHDMENKKQLLLSLDNLQVPAVAIRPQSRERIILVVGKPPQPLGAGFGQSGGRLPIGR
jgi:hypothetical protein